MGAWNYPYILSIGSAVAAIAAGNTVVLKPSEVPANTSKIMTKIIEQINARPKPLSCYVFTSDKRIKNKILREISFGGGAVNESVMHFSNSNLPFGGVGESGIGSYHGEYGFKTFTHYKSIIDKQTFIEPGIKYFPHTNFKLKLIKRIL